MLAACLLSPKVEVVLLLLFLLLLLLECWPLRLQRYRSALLQWYVDLFRRMEHLVGRRLPGELLLGLLLGEWPGSGEHVLLSGLRLQLMNSRSVLLLLLLLWLLLLLLPVRFPWLIVLLAVVFLAGVETAARVVSVPVPECHVWPGIELFRVHRPVQEVVDEVVLRRLFADVLATGRHADQMHL